MNYSCLVLTEKTVTRITSLNSVTLFPMNSLRRQFFERISKKLNVNKLEDWYNVNVQDVYNNGGGTIYTKSL